MDLPNPLLPLSDALEAVSQVLRGIWAPVVCWCRQCIYAPFFVASRERLKSGMVINRYTYVCVRCGKAKTVSSGRHARFRRRANISWDHYETKAHVGQCVRPPLP